MYEFSLCAKAVLSQETPWSLLKPLCSGVLPAFQSRAKSLQYALLLCFEAWLCHMPGI